MKKILLIALAIATVNTASAQIYEANDSTAFSSWTSYDLDSDGNGFIAAEDFNGMSAISFSYDNASGPLTPDNLFVSPAIDLSTGSSLMLNYTVTAIDQGWVAEKYAIYIVNNVAALATGNFPAPVTEEILTTGVLTRNIDISAQADGQSTVYVVLRHYDCTDQFAIGFDNLNITGDFASVEDNKVAISSAYPNPTVDVLNINVTEEVASLKVLNLEGKVVINNNSVNSSVINLDVNELAPGMYVYEVTTKDGAVARETFVKK